MNRLPEFLYKWRLFSFCLEQEKPTTTELENLLMKDIDWDTGECNLEAFVEKNKFIKDALEKWKIQSCKESAKNGQF